MKLERQQKRMLLKGIPHASERMRTAFMPLKPAEKNSARPRIQALLRTPGVTLPGVGAWRRPENAKRH